MTINPEGYTSRNIYYAMEQKSLSWYNAYTIYAGNGKIVHARGKKYSIVVSDYFSKKGLVLVYVDLIKNKRRVVWRRC